MAVAEVALDFSGDSTPVGDRAPLAASDAMMTTTSSCHGRRPAPRHPSAREEEERPPMGSTRRSGTSLTVGDSAAEMEALTRWDERRERATYRRHARWLVWFNTCRMERSYLDILARVRKHEVYVGYALVIFVAVIWLIKRWGVNEFIDYACDADDDLLECSGFKFDSWSDLWLQSHSLVYSAYIFPVAAAICALGCLAQWLIHRSPRVREKSWAMLAVGLTVVTLSVYEVAFQIAWLQPLHWPDAVMRRALFIFAMMAFFSGSARFALFLCIWFTQVAILLVGYGVTHDQKTRQYGPGSLEVRSLNQFFIYALHRICVFSVVYIVGLFLEELQSRRQFLRRVVMADQQHQIIREKTKNSALQRELLENMLPPSVVAQLQRQNFDVASRDSLRDLSHRHLGVSLLFADLEGFAAFSSQVPPPLVMQYLNDLFLVFDGLCEAHCVFKVETVGDQYVAAVGVVTGEVHKTKASDLGTSLKPGGESDPHAAGAGMKEEEKCQSGSSLREACVSNTAHVLEYAEAILRSARHVAPPGGAEAAQTRPVLRVGVHTGACMSGIVGTKSLRFCLFGDAMNTAARMLQHGLPGCIHTTAKVAELAPERDWEKRRRMRVKGKGDMQTYLLRVVDGDPSAAASLSDDAPSSLFAHHLSESESSEEEEGEEKKKSADGRGRGLSRGRTLGSGPSLSRFDGGSAASMYERTEIDYSEHLRCCGLLFKKRHVEVAYLDNEAIKHRNIVYIGFGLMVLILLSNDLVGYVMTEREDNLCKDPDLQEFCVENFLILDNDSADNTTDYPLMYYDAVLLNEMGHHHFIHKMDAFAGKATYPFGDAMTNWCTVLCYSFAGIGLLAQWLIHRLRCVKHKAWALLATFAVYALQAVPVYVCTFLIIQRQSNAQLPGTVLHITTVQATLFIFFSGVPFFLYLIYWIIISAFLWGLGVPQALTSAEESMATGRHDATMAMLNWMYGASFLFWYGIVLLLARYLNDVTSRKRFLMRMLMMQQQNQIIQEKEKAERMERSFLESILPPALVEELKCQPSDLHHPCVGDGGGNGNDGGMDDAKQAKAEARHRRLGKSRRRLRSLTQTHQGVALLYADLVGFTAFSAQVDPFKVMTFLNDLFQVFDSLCDACNVYKIETVGDCYVASVGVVTGEVSSMELSGSLQSSLADAEAKASQSESEGESASGWRVSGLQQMSMARTAAALNARDLLCFAKAMIRGSRQVRKPVVGTPATLRVGMHSGGCISGIVGTRSLKFCLFGDSVETAAAMERAGVPGCVHASQDLARLLPEERWEEREAARDKASKATYLLSV